MFAEDLSVFFRDFGAQATLGAATVRGVLGSGFDDAALDGYGMGAGTSPTFVLPSAVVPAKPELPKFPRVEAAIKSNVEFAKKVARQQAEFAGQAVRTLAKTSAK